LLSGFIQSFIIITKTQLRSQLSNLVALFGLVTTITLISSVLLTTPQTAEAGPHSATDHTTLVFGHFVKLSLSPPLPAI
jgi:hypothetical protein